MFVPVCVFNVRHIFAFIKYDFSKFSVLVAKFLEFLSRAELIKYICGPDIVHNPPVCSFHKKWLLSLHYLAFEMRGCRKEEK